MARYKEAIQWIALNDDNEWLKESNGIISVTATMVADIFNKTEEEVTEDLRNQIEKNEKKERSKT